MSDAMVETSRRSSSSSKKSSSSSSSSSKSILKKAGSSDQRHMRIEELLETELPLPASSSSSKHRHHDKSNHHRKRRTEENESNNDENNRRNRSKHREDEQDEVVHSNRRRSKEDQVESARKSKSRHRDDGAEDSQVRRGKSKHREDGDHDVVSEHRSKSRSNKHHRDGNNEDVVAEQHNNRRSSKNHREVLNEEVVAAHNNLRSSKHHRDVNDDVAERSSNRRSSKHNRDGNNDEDVVTEQHSNNRRSSSKHHDFDTEDLRRSSKPHKKSHRSTSKPSDDVDCDVIYDLPKTPAVKYPEDEGVFRAVPQTVDMGFYENCADMGVGSDPAMMLYDVPRSNKNKNHVVMDDDHEEEEAIYQNDISAVDDAAEEPWSTADACEVSYDIPRLNNSGGLQLPEDYDVPKMRDSLSTIEEEQHNEYDVPASARMGHHTHNNNNVEVCVPNEDNFYLNQSDLVASVGKHHMDDKSSSGYRSSSSPSIQSETTESMEDLASVVAVDTRRRSTSTTTSTTSAMTSAEVLREQERARAEEIEAEIRRKRSEHSRHAKPFDYFNRKEETSYKKKDGKMAPAVDDDEQKLDVLPVPPPPPPTTSSNNINSDLPKKPSQRDRSVDVYHETVRQRVPSSKSTPVALSREVFFSASAEDVSAVSGSVKSSGGSGFMSSFKRKKSKAPVPTIIPKEQGSVFSPSESNPEEMPSVRQLRTRFESAKSSPPVSKSASSASAVASWAKKLSSSQSSASFLVKSSLTRRGAVAMSRSLHNLSEAVRSSPKEKQQPPDTKWFSSEQPIKRNAAEETATSSSSAVAAARRETASHVVQLDNNNSAGTALTDLQEEEIGDENGLRDVPDLVARLYRVQRLERDEAQKYSAGATHLEGQLERLPQGKKKSLLFNAWKKQYVVADRGFLQTFADSGRSQPLETVELFGGRVEATDAGGFTVHDRRGTAVVLRCSEKREAERWRNVLAAHTSQDFSRSFLVPSPLSQCLSLLTNVLVIDFGGASVRAGVAAKLPTLPRLFFPSVMAVAHNDEQEKYFGMDAFAEEIRTRCKLLSPMVPSDRVDRFSINLLALQGICEKIFKDLSVDPAHYEIQLSLPRSVSTNTKAAVATMLFEEFGVAAVNMAHQTSFAFHAYNARSGVLVDVGERTDVVPIVDGQKVTAGSSKLPTGGKELRSKLRHYLLGRNYSLTSFADDYITRYAVEKLAYLPLNIDKELDRYRDDSDSIDRTLAVFDSASELRSDDHAWLRDLEMGSERFEACEGLFKPEIWGQDHQAGIHVLVHKAIRECGMDSRKELSQSILLAGGLTLIEGFRERLEAEMERLTTVRPRVHASPYRYHAAYMGAAVHAGTEAYVRARLTRAEWRAAPDSIEHHWTV